MTIQAQILARVMQELRERTDAGIVLSRTTSASWPTSPTASSSCTRGRVVEQGTLDEIFYDPQHPYTWGLLGSIARVDRAAARAPAGDPGHCRRRCTTRPQGCHFRPRCRHEFEQCARGAGARGARSRRAAAPDRCWLPLDEKRSKREIADGQIGLEAKGVIA